MNDTKPRFIKQALLLTIISLIMRTVGTGFMIYISNKIGEQGIGLYQLTYSLYFLFITFSTSGISIAVTRIVAEQSAIDNHSNAKSAFNKCLALSIILSLLSTFALYSLAPFLAEKFLMDVRTTLSLKILAVGLPFLSVASVIRGYFLGIKKGIKASTTDMVEAGVQIVASIILISILAPKGIEYACCALVISATLSEIISCIYSVIIYKLEKKCSNGEKTKGISKQIFSIIIPISISNYIRSTLNTIENVAMPQGLKKFGQNYGEALSQYGMIKGMVMPILFFPSAVLVSFANLLVPEVSGANAMNNKKRIDYIISKSFKTTLLFAFFVTGIFLCFSHELGMAFYKNSRVGSMLLTLAPLVPLMYLDMIVDSILKGLNQQLSSMKYNSMDAVIRTLIIILLVPICGVKGYAIMFYTGTIFNALLSINRLVVVSKVQFKPIKWVILPIVAITLACLITALLIHTNVFIKIIFVLFCYVVILILLGCITKRDLKWLSRIFNK